MLHEKIRAITASGAMPLQGPEYESVQRQLASFNQYRLAAGLGEPDEPQDVALRSALLELESAFVRSVLGTLSKSLEHIPDYADGFVDWFQTLREIGPGQGDVLFPWLANRADFEQMKWFLTQEISGETGFDDLVALSQIKMPARAKLEMARNYWDEMGRGQAKGMHGPMLGQLAAYFSIAPTVETTVPESLALGNMMMALACNRRYGFHSIGALGVIELTAPSRATYVSRGLDRLGVPKKRSHYFSLHAILDVKHSDAWIREVVWPLVAEDSRRARAIAEGALLRLWCGAQCFERYRQEFKIGPETTALTDDLMAGENHAI
jgi:hypothetical protein